ncbi:MAG: hypothetical protein OXG58_02445 [Gemmatimonadetes bacterium]|nr:hypothetical protein [Gemmatimonadota bacterium]MCY3944042.1 hypothetical protein [Gemmatimonadota bacterium]
MTRQRGMIAPGTAVALAIAIFVAAVCQVACRAEASAQATRDSAGIRIVDNARPADGSRLPWRVGAGPAVSIGEVVGEEAYLLHRANDATILPDGRIVIANTGSSELRVFDAAGVHLATWGREGEGPGEFTSLAGVEPWPGDSVVAWNNRTWVISVFDAEGALGRSFTLDSEAGALEPRAVQAIRGHYPRQRRDSEAGALEPRAVLHDGSILGRTGEVTGDGYRRSQETYELRPSYGGSPVGFGTHPGQESHIGYEGGIALMGLLPFGRSLWEAEWGELVILTTDDNYEVRAYDPSTGALARIVRREYENRAPTREEVDEALEAALERAGLTGPSLKMTRRGYGSMPIVEQYPAFNNLLTDPLDHLWVREATLPGIDRPAPLWTVFDPEGRALGFIETPDGVTVYEIGADYLLGLATDEMGVESVQLWELER